MKRTSSILCAALVVAMLAISCAKPPTEEINNATEAVTRAENNQDAVTYAGNTLARARDALTKMNAEAASKRYDAARSYAAEAIAAAEKAIIDGRTGAERARNDAAAIVSRLKPLIEETEQGINAARTANLPLDYDSIDTEFSTARHEADQAQIALSSSRYGDATDRGRSARQRLNDINQQLAITSMAVTRKK